jgi:hypothetical protein
MFKLNERHFTCHFITDCSKLIYFFGLPFHNGQHLLYQNDKYFWRDGFVFIQSFFTTMPHIWLPCVYIIPAFNVHGSVHHKIILIYVQQDAMLHSLFYLETALHVWGGTTTHHQERKQLYLQHLVFVIALLLPAAIMEEAGSSNAVTNTRCCRYSCLHSWWWVVVPPDTCSAVSG